MPFITCDSVCLWSQQYMQVQDQPAQMWSQAQAALQKMPPMQMSMKQPQQQQTFYMAAQDPLKLYEHQLQPPAQPQLSNMDKKIKYPDVKMQDFYWDPSYRMGDGLAVMADRMKRPGSMCSEQDASAGPRGPPFEVSRLRCCCPAAVLSLGCSFLPSPLCFLFSSESLCQLLQMFSTVCLRFFKITPNLAGLPVEPQGFF